MDAIHILKPGNSDIINKKYAKFQCLCGCVWEADETAYLEDWSMYSIPKYCACPTCHRLVYCLSDMKPENTRGYADYTVRSTARFCSYRNYIKAWNERFPDNLALNEYEGLK